MVEWPWSKTWLNNNHKVHFQNYTYNYSKSKIQFPEGEDTVILIKNNIEFVTLYPNKKNCNRTYNNILKL